MAKTKKTKRMPIEDMPQKFLNAEREPVNFDALMDEALRVGMHEGLCNGCPMWNECYYPNGRQKLFEDN
jgi:hypothetical protein